MEKKIKDFSNYSIDAYGNINNIRLNRLMKVQKCRAGYSRVYLTNDNGKRFAFSVHRLVAHYFVSGESKDNNEVNHIDGNKDNNHMSNLEWCNRKYNMQHASKVLNKNMGNPEHRVKNKIIKHLADHFTRDEIATAFSTTYNNITRILNNE